MVIQHSYKDLRIWQESVSLIKEVYFLADQLPKSEEYNLKQQLKRAVVSVALNIAEGKNRRTAKDFAGFLTISSGSLAETDAVLTICCELDLLKEHETETIFQNIQKLGKMINAFKSKLREDS